MIDARWSRGGLIVDDRSREPLLLELDDGREVGVAGWPFGTSWRTTPVAVEAGGRGIAFGTSERVHVLELSP